MKFGFNWFSGFLGKEVWKCWIWVTLDQGQWMTLTLIFMKVHVLIYFTASTKDHNSFWEIHLFPYKSISAQIWLCRKIGQSRWTNLVVLEYPMLHTKVQGHRHFGSGEEDFLKVYTAWWASWSCDLDRLYKHSFPHPKEAPHEIWLQSAQWFQRRCLKMLTTHIYIQTTRGLPIL